MTLQDKSNVSVTRFLKLAGAKLLEFYSTVNLKSTKPKHIIIYSHYGRQDGSSFSKNYKKKNVKHTSSEYIN